MKKDFVIRGQTASGETEILEFGGYKENYAYIMTEFQIYPSSALGSQAHELSATVTAAKTYEDPSNPNFNNDGLIATALHIRHTTVGSVDSIVNDTFLITQNLILAVIDAYAGTPMPVNWQCRFKAVKMTDAAAAVQNFRQFSIFDE